MTKLYLIGSLRNKRVPELANYLRQQAEYEQLDLTVFDDWFAAGEEADDKWKEYEQARGRTYEEALKGEAAKNVFAFDTRHLRDSTHVLLVLPAGKSGHMEAMYAKYALGAETAILLDPDDVRWDVMYQFIPNILSNDEAVLPWLIQTQGKKEQDEEAIKTTTSIRQQEWGCAQVRPEQSPYGLVANRSPDRYSERTGIWGGEVFGPQLARRV